MSPAVSRLATPPHASCGTRRGIVVAIMAATALVSGCDERAVRHTVRIDLTRGEPGVPVTVETTFAPQESRSPQDERLIQETLDLFALGRDPWIRGFQRAGSDQPTVTIEGPPDGPSVIRRTGRLPDMQALVSLVPDAIANVTLREDARRGTMSLEIVHIDAPEHVRDARRQIERELNEFAQLAFDWSESACDLYDHLREDRQRGREVFLRLRDGAGDVSLDLLDHEASTLSAAMEERLEAMVTWLGAEREDGEEVHRIAGMTFRPFDHDLEVILPVEATEAIGFERIETNGEEHQGGEIRYGLEALHAFQLLDAVVPQADPPVPMGEMQILPPEGLDTLPSFTCRRHGSTLSIKKALWERLLPRSRYELIWPSR